MKLTLWYHGTVKPVREGVYERDYGIASRRDLLYSYWNGKFWGVWATTPFGAVTLKKRLSAYQNLPWRGVAK